MEGRGTFASLCSRQRPCHAPKDSSPPSGREPQRCRRASALCQAPGDRWTLSPPELERGVRESEQPLLAGVHSVFCWLHPRAHGARGCSGHRPPRPSLPSCILHPPQSLEIRPPSPREAPAPLLPVPSSFPSLGPLQAACHLATTTTNFLETKSHTSRKRQSQEQKSVTLETKQERKSMKTKIRFFEKSVKLINL